MESGRSGGRHGGQGVARKGSSSIIELMPSTVQVMRTFSTASVMMTPFQLPSPMGGEIAADKNLSLLQRLRRMMTFKVIWASYYIFTTLLGGVIISLIDNLPFIDGYFMASSSMCGAGLSTVSMLQLSSGTFIVLAILMLIGCPPFLIIVTTSIRRYRLRLLRAEALKNFREREQRVGLRLSPQNKAVVAYYRKYDRALGILVWVFVSYFIGFLVVGSLALFGALFIQPLATELAGRGIGRWAEASFTIASAMSNCGLTLTSDSLIGWSNNPTAYVIVTVLILAGNTGAPVLYRLQLRLLLRVDRALARLFPQRAKSRRAQSFRKALLFVLANPRKLTTHVFDSLQTVYLGLTVLVFCTVQFVFFLGSTLHRREALDHYSVPTLVGIGYFQTLSTRNAGFAMMDLRLLSQGLLVIYMLMMYLSAFPLVTSILNSEVHDTEINKLNDQVFRDHLDRENLAVALTEAASATGPAGSCTSLMQPDECSSDGTMEKPSTPKPHPRRGWVDSGPATPRLPRRHSVHTLALKREAAENVRSLPPLSERDSDSDRGSCVSANTLAGPSSPSPLPPAPSQPQQPQQILLLPAAADGLSLDELTENTISLYRAGALSRVSPTPSISRGFIGVDAGSEDDEDEIAEERSAASVCSARASRHSSERSADGSMDGEAIERMQTGFAHQFLLRHTFFLVLAIVVLAYSEEKLLQVDNPAQVNLFYILFEMVSSYGNVGLSLGVPGETYSLSGAMSTVGKLVIISVMILGKQRGLPSSTDEVIDYEFREYRAAWHLDDPVVGGAGSERVYRRRGSNGSLPSQFSY